MNFSEKLAFLRKKHTLSVDELAAQLGINRRTLMKWERGELMPDISMIVKLSNIFGISTDALIKNEILISDNGSLELPKEKRHISYADAEAYLKSKFKTAYLIALATFLIMLSPGIMLVIMSLPGSSQILLNGIGLTVLFVFVSASLAIYMHANILTGKYDFI